ncbi:hypothetical protein AXG93_2482s1150 [Marchantia polymorpha subsp. ruderalis]|uniref:Uncharacterized protein n=1 Tax=Marchantia polymorpha subsp. ruderalis TaxID=1480154 RepID=A0A176VD15_MARPO|nr:hypothetical protein AXG93_2482s1150 [Marchantia polymorpha subsp. ruderalis]
MSKNLTHHKFPVAGLGWITPEEYRKYETDYEWLVMARQALHSSSSTLQLVPVHDETKFDWLRLTPLSEIASNKERPKKKCRRMIIVSDTDEEYPAMH